MNAEPRKIRLHAAWRAGISDTATLSAIERVRGVRPTRQDQAYENIALPIGQQILSQPEVA